MDLQVMRGHNDAVNLLREQIIPGRFGERGTDLLQETALALDVFDDALVFQLCIGFGHGVSVHPQFLGQRPDARQGLAGPEAAAGGGVPDLLHELEIHRRAGLEINLQEHTRLLS